MTRTDEIAARLAGATAGEWWTPGWGYGASHGLEYEVSTEEGRGIWTAHCQNEADAAFIAAAPSDVAYLLAEVARLRAVVKALTATVTRYETILHEETAAARELAALLENAAPGDAERLRAAEVRLERAIAEREGIEVEHAIREALEDVLSSAAELVPHEEVVRRAKERADKRRGGE